MTELLRVVVADDHPMFREGLRVLLGSAPQIALVGEAATGEQAVEMVLALQPDVVLMDLRLPDISGIEATRRIAAGAPHVGVLVITMFEDDESVFASMRAGAQGYLLKGADHDEIVRAIVAVAHGEAIFGPGVARRVLGYFAGASPSPAFPELTVREREVLELVAAGRGNAAIARSLFLNDKTVRNHVSNILSKLCAADRAQAIIRAREAGFGRSLDM